MSKFGAIKWRISLEYSNIRFSKFWTKAFSYPLELKYFRLLNLSSF